MALPLRGLSRIQPPNAAPVPPPLRFAHHARALTCCPSRRAPTVGIVEVVEEEEGAGGAEALAAFNVRQRRAELAAAALEVVALYAAPLEGGGGLGDGSSGAIDGDGAADGVSSTAAGNGGSLDCGDICCGGAAAALAIGEADAQIISSTALQGLVARTERASLQLPTPWGGAEASQEAQQLLCVLGDLLSPGKAGSGAPGLWGRQLAAAAQQWLLPRLRDTLFAPHRHAQAQERGASGEVVRGRRRSHRSPLQPEPFA
jgi:hypothetical protein